MNALKSLLPLIGLLIATASLPAVVISNPSFEEGATGSTFNSTVQDWFGDGTGTNMIVQHESGGSMPQTDFGNWWLMVDDSSSAWAYQEVGTFSENTPFEVAFLAGQRDSGNQRWTGLKVQIWGGGDSSQAGEDVALDGAVGATLLAESAILDPFTDAQGIATQNLSVILNTGTEAGLDSSSPLWLQFVGAGVANGRHHVDNVSMTVIPEPSAAALLLGGLVGLLLFRRRR